MVKKNTTDNLLPKRSFLTGVSSILNLSGSVKFSYSKTPEEADRKAIKSDWDMVGQDFRAVIDNLLK